MSGAETSLVDVQASSVISIIDATLDYYLHMKDKKDLPEAFHSVARVLSTVRDILGAFREQINRPPGIGIAKSQSAIITFDNEAIWLREMFHIVARSGEEPCAEYLKAALTVSKGVPVESMMKKILEGVQLLVDDHLVDMASDKQTKALAKALEEISTIPPSIPEDIYSQNGNHNSRCIFNAVGGTNYYNFGGGNHVILGKNAYFGDEIFKNKR
ncbi:hypothetical protein N7499_003119 [Penicillium canescens]|uniref:NACHT-NTPase and P-loop NTPases N-terminal domain-containing protein n=1 Tax=Penicillium canescens TaxID=5083 RepID=A0AAD6IBJ1_PENCN|nr:uncharacterized protein N7446_011990 [Penicillium canescens]KAJ6019784.1 hypothetical protein N7522_000492 [Penicillium canescens]KAJ6039074.1 hypothetical protein N7460_007106 [Penicillium canescens]KAJ6047156.1 hypothetical protein N7446_011990 [Penicillium canescens]KAJ6059905.1 hypothetical protein N7444_003544 [Penicillium canescens]KAJ6093788.1 hypothetical protein N7499_003119 [Penicillium canescens]